MQITLIGNDRYSISVSYIDGGQLNYVHIESNYILFGHVKQEN